MKRMLLAVGVAVLASLMLVPMVWGSDTIMCPFFFLLTCPCRMLWTPFALQAIFLSVLAAVIVNLPPRRTKK